MSQEKNWTQLWLKYEPKKEQGNASFFTGLVWKGFDLENAIVKNAQKELNNGIQGMLGIALACKEEDKATLIIKKSEDAQINEEGYLLKEVDGTLTLSARDEKGVLYGVFHILRMVAMEKSLKGMDALVNPDNPLRMYNHWDNMDGSIERGYSGNSFFFVNNEVVVDERTVDYARFVASIGINGVVINNVNVKNCATWLITDRYFEKVAQMAEIFAGYGIKFFLSLNYAATIELGGLDSADPLDEGVIAWWKEKMAEVFAKIPNLGGFLVKADSEGRPGPFTYGRTQADGANMLADIVKPYGGIIIWRCFVYNCTQDWRDYKTDRARAGYDNFIQMDGDYHDNVILQIKNGPMDFQIREPISPLLGGLKKTNQMLEVQVAQEYTGHQIDVCYLIPLFKEVLDFHTYCKEGADTVADVISGRTLGNKNTGIAAVINTGNDANWTGNDLAAANFYGFGRLGFTTSLSSEEILEEWIRMTISTDEDVIDTIKGIMLPSRATYEKYTCPLGIGWMVTPNTHYGCSVDGYEYSRWGTYHRADHLGIGVDRTDKGTGYAKQYYEPNASMYNNMETCPEELLLFFHHVPYTYVLKTGKTLIQHIYDTHFEGVEEVEQMIAAWDSLEGKIPADTFNLVKGRFGRQLYNAKEWRDQVNSYFFRKSGIADEKGRAIY
ncbi:MAG: alpha-glucuronidase [Lachnospiraceae bacterium]|nr:alpha-glucuronidase [Lachnospiraceae bacterium]